MEWTLFFMAAGALQGILLSLVILKKPHRNGKANKWLSTFILTFALVSLSDFFDRTLPIHKNSALFHLFDWGYFLLGPLLLMYLREMTGEKYQKKNSWYLHFLPSLLMLLLLIPIYVLPLNKKNQIAIADQKDRMSGTLDIFAIFIVVQIALYFIWGFVVLLRYSQRLKENYSALEKRNLDWLKILIGINLLLWTIMIFAQFTSNNMAKILNDIGFPIAIYIFGYLGLMQVDLESEHKTIASNSEPSLELELQNDLTPNKKSMQSGNRYVRSGLTAEKAAVLKEKLDALMLDKKPYFEEDLNLRELADRLEVLPHHLSQLLNEHYNQNFFDYINSYRAQEVKNMLSDPSQKNESILSIAFSCGFNSKATFNSFFKKHTGRTPRQFRADFESEKVQST